MEIGSRVQVVGKDLIGVLAFKGNVLFAEGIYIGIILDEPKGKNNGTVRDHKYFECGENYGIMVPEDRVRPFTDGSNNKLLTPSSRTTSELSLASNRSSTESRASAAASVRSNQRAPSSRVFAAADVQKHASTTSGSARRPVSSSSKVSAKSGNTSHAAEMPPPASGLPPVGARTLNSTNLATPAQTHTQALKRPSLMPPKHATNVPSSSRLSSIKVGESKDFLSLAAAAVDSVVAAAPPTSSLHADTVNVNHFDAYDAAESISKLEAEKADLASKLETLRVKRAEDKANLKEWEKLKLQYQQLEIYNKRVSENNTQLHADCDDLKLKLTEQQQQLSAAAAAEKSFSASALGDDISSQIENLTLDKEIAEQRAELLEEQNKLLTKQLAEQQTSRPPPATESDSTSSPGNRSDSLNLSGASGDSHTAANNAKLESELTELRTSYNNVCAALVEISNAKVALEDEVTVLRQETSLLNPLYAQAAAELAATKIRLNEMRDELELAGSAQEMVELLTDKNLTLGEKLDEQQAQIEQLSELRDTNNELLEHSQYKEKEYLNELSKRDAFISQLKMEVCNLERDAKSNVQQVSRFAEQMRQTEADNVELRRMMDAVDATQHATDSNTKNGMKLANLSAASSEHSAVHQQRLQRKLVAALVSGRRQRLEWQLASLRHDYALAFMPDTFMKAREYSYIDAACALVMLLEKCSLLEQQLTTTFNSNPNIAVAAVDGNAAAVAEESLVLSVIDDKSMLNVGVLYHEHDRSNFAAYLLFVCECVRYVGSKCERRACAANDLSPLIGFVPKLSKASDDVEYYIKLLQDNHLDENVAVEPLEQSFYTLLTEQRNLSFDFEQQASQTTSSQQQLPSSSTDSDFLRSILDVINRAVMSLGQSLAWLKHLTSPTQADNPLVSEEENQDILAQYSATVTRFEAALVAIMDHVRACRRSLDTDATVYVLRLPAETRKSLDTRPTIVLNVVRLMYRWVRLVSQASHAKADANAMATATAAPPSTSVVVMDAGAVFSRLRDANNSLGAASFATNNNRSAPSVEMCEVLEELVNAVKSVSHGLEKGQWFGGSFEVSTTNMATGTTEDANASASPSNRRPSKFNAVADDQQNVVHYAPMRGLLRRAEQFKKQFADAEALRYDVANKQQDIVALQHQLQNKVEEIDALNLRVKTFERKFESSSNNRESELGVLRRGNVELEAVVKKSEAEVEAQRSLFMQKIKDLEQEKRTLEQHLRQAGKRFLAGGTGAATITSDGGAADDAVKNGGDFTTGVGGGGCAPVDAFSFMTPPEEISTLRTIVSQQAAELTLTRLKLADNLLLTQLVPHLQPNGLTPNAANAGRSLQQNTWTAKADYLQKQINMIRREYYDLSKCIDFTVSPQEMRCQAEERDTRQALIVQKLQRLKREMQQLDVEKQNMHHGNFYVK